MTDQLQLGNLAGDDEATPPTGFVTACVVAFVAAVYGLSRQIVPTILGELLAGDADQSQRVLQALLKIVKLDVRKLKEAVKRRHI